MRFAVDHDTAIYMQRTSFLLGPDVSLNEQLRHRLPVAVEERRAKQVDTPLEAIRGHPRELMNAEEWNRVYALGANLGLSKSESQGLGHYFGWKLKLARTRPERILAFGASTGGECMIIHAIFPAAKQTVLDFNLGVPDPWLAPLGIESTHRETLESYVEKHDSHFDLVFSNHTLEHLADPERALGQLFALLKPGGVLVSAVPMEWYIGSIAKAAVERMEASRTLHPLDCSDLHLGHLWKTSPRDVADTLTRVGFTEVRLAQREDYPTAWRHQNPLHREALERRVRMAEKLNRASLLPLRQLLKRVFPHRVPRAIARNYFRLEARLWFSNLQLHHTTVRELAFVGKKPT